MFWSKTLNRGFSSLHPPLDLRRQLRAADNVRCEAKRLSVPDDFAAFCSAEFKLLHLLPCEKPPAKHHALREAIFAAFYSADAIRIPAEQEPQPANDAEEQQVLGVRSRQKALPSQAGH